MLNETDRVQLGVEREPKWTVRFSSNEIFSDRAVVYIGHLHSSWTTHVDVEQLHQLAEICLQAAQDLIDKNDE